MKKGIVLALVFLLLLSMTACGSQSKETTPATSEATEVPAEATTEPTVPAPTEPAWEPGVVRQATAKRLTVSLISVHS